MRGFLVCKSGAGSSNGQRVSVHGKPDYEQNIFMLFIYAIWTMAFLCISGSSDRAHINKIHPAAAAPAQKAHESNSDKSQWKSAPSSYSRILTASCAPRGAWGAWGWSSICSAHDVAAAAMLPLGVSLCVRSFSQTQRRKELQYMWAIHLGTYGHTQNAQHNTAIEFRTRLLHPPPPFRCRRVGEIELQSKLICFFFDIQKYKYECYQSQFFLVGVLHKCHRFLLNHVNISTFVSQNNTMSTNNRNNLQVRVGIGICINCSLRCEHCGWSGDQRLAPFGRLI